MKNNKKSTKLTLFTLLMHISSSYFEQYISSDYKKKYLKASKMTTFPLISFRLHWLFNNVTQ